MHYVYILYSLRDKKLYTGCTNNLQERLRLHNARKIVSTKNHTPMKLIYCEIFINKQDAFAEEQWLKTGWGRNRLQKILQNTLKNLGG